MDQEHRPRQRLLAAAVRGSRTSRRSAASAHDQLALQLGGGQVAPVRVAPHPDDLGL
jgi:hypothetical protein